MTEIATTAKHYVTVRTKAQLREMYEHIAEHDTLAIDTETTTLNPRKGQIVGWSVSGKPGYGYYLPTRLWNKDTESLEDAEVEGVNCNTLSKKMLADLKGKKLIAHNFSFDGRYIKNYYGVDLIPDLWVETLLLVHTVQEEGTGMGVFGLKAIAISIQKELGLDIEEAANKEQIALKESIKLNGGSTTKELFEIYKADLDILGEYAAADTDLTFRICMHFLGKLKEENLEKFFFEEEVMPIYKEVTIPMEEAGVDLDLDLLHRTNEDIIAELEKNKRVVIESLMAEEGTREWVIATAMKNYPPSSKGKWAQRLCETVGIELPVTESGRVSIKKEHIQTLPDSKYKDFLLTGNVDVLEELEVVGISTALWKEENGGDYLNIQSKLHLGEIVFKYMGIKPLTQTKTGRDQFDMDMIEELSKTHQWAENLRVYNKLLKIRSTYIDRFLDNHEDGKWYPYYKQHGTVSGRYGSDAQQLPKPKEEGDDVPIILHYNNLVRAFLISGKDYVFIDADYVSLEPVCFASVTGDKNLQEIFHNGWDFYSTIAIRTEKLDQDKQRYPDGVSPDKKAHNFLKKLNPTKRNQAKAYSLGIAYGMEAYALAMTLGVSQKEADKLVQGYLDGFPDLKAWREVSRAQVKTHGFIKNKVGRIRHLPIAQQVYARYGDKLMDYKFRRELEMQYGKDNVMQLYRDYRNALNNCLNYQLQSLAAAVVNRAALQINRKAKELNIDARVVIQVHDQLVVRVKEDQAKTFMPIVQQLMEHTTELPGVNLMAPPEIALNLKEGH